MSPSRRRAAWIVAVVLTGMLLSGCGTVVWTLGPIASASRKGGVYIYRPEQLTAGAMWIHVSSAFGSRQVYNGGYAFLPLPPGKHLVTVLMGKSRNVDVEGQVVRTGWKPIPLLPTGTLESPSAEERAMGSKNVADHNETLARLNLQMSAATAFSSLVPAGEPYPAAVWPFASLVGGSVDDEAEVLVEVDVPADGVVYLRTLPAGFGGGAIEAEIVSPGEASLEMRTLQLSPGGMRDLGLGPPTAEAVPRAAESATASPAPSPQQAPTPPP